jgi:PAS domain S-box-containing protein
VSKTSVWANVEEESLYRKLFEVAGDSIIVCSEHGVAIECNQAALDLFGCTREQLLGTSPVDWSPEFQPGGGRSDEMAAEVFSRVKAKEMTRFEWENWRADGSRLPVDVTVRSARIDGRDLFVVISRDITERRATEDILRISEEKYRALIETTGTGYLIVDKEGRVVDANPAYVRLTGHDDIQEILGRSVVEWTASDQREKNAAAVAQCSRNGFIRDFVIDYVDGNGRVTPIEVNATVVGEGDSIRIIALCRDIMERKQAEGALRESEERWKFAIEGAGDGLWDWHIQTGKAFYSPRYKEMLGFAENEIGATADEWSKRIHPEDAPGVFAAMQPYMHGKPGSAIVEFRMLCKDGTWQWTSGRGMVMERDAEGKPLRMIGTNTDITDRKRAEAELIAAKTAAETASLTKSRFLAAASHDLRQPMQAISLFNEALARTSLNGEQKRISDYLSQSIKSMGDLLDALLDISKLDAGAIKANPEVIQADALVHKISDDFSAMAAEKSLRFKLCFPFRDMAMVTDGKLLMSLLGNLIGNAIKYTEEGGILVAIRRRGNQALLQVWDTGIGIPAEHLDAIYEEYFQIGNPERDRRKGLGLGLAIAKRIAKLLETTVVCRSRPGKGSVFEFRLPLISREMRATPTRIDPPAVGNEAKPSGCRIVLVEDDLMVATAMKLTLEACGTTVTRYKTAEEALADPAITDADFYISDLRLPGLTGVEFLDAVQRRATKPIHAVVVTGDTAIDRIDMMQSTSWRVLFKPVELSSLLSAIGLQDSMH